MAGEGEERTRRNRRGMEERHSCGTKSEHSNDTFSCRTKCSYLVNGKANTRDGATISASNWNDTPISTGLVDATPILNRLIDAMPISSRPMDAIPISTRHVDATPISNRLMDATPSSSTKSSVTSSSRNITESSSSAILETTPTSSSVHGGTATSSSRVSDSHNMCGDRLNISIHVVSSIEPNAHTTCGETSSQLPMQISRNHIHETTPTSQLTTPTATSSRMSALELDECRRHVDLRMIDFARSTHSDHYDHVCYEGLDECYMSGLDYLIHVFQKIIDDPSFVEGSDIEREASS